jgi:serine/threonine-protein kinase
MAAFSANHDEGEHLSPRPGLQEGDSLDENPTVKSSDPLALEKSAEPAPAALEPRRVEATNFDDEAENRNSAALEPPDALPISDAAPPALDEPESFPEERTVLSKRPPIANVQFDQTYTPHELGQALVGKQLAHFQLEEFLGGGMGAVFRGRDLTLGRNVAIKVLPRGQDEDTIRRFQNEAQSAARLNHENIARVYYVGEEDGWNFIIFEHIEGPTIRQLVAEQGPLTLEEAIHHTLQAAEALDHAFRRDVVHRDIKPSNLIVSSEGSTKLVDMGLARLHQVESSRNDLTASGVTLGTFDYISPEQARDPRSADVRSDLYSLGCTLYFMLTGRPPFPEGTVLQKLLDHQSRQPPDVRLFRPELPESAVSILNKLLAKRPEDRYQSPKELIADLATFLDWQELPTAAPRRNWTSAATGPRSRLETHLGWIAPTALLIAAAFYSEWRRDAADQAFSFPAVVVPAEEPVPRKLQEPESPQGVAAAETSPPSAVERATSDRARAPRADASAVADRAAERRLPQASSVTARDRSTANATEPTASDRTPAERRAPSGDAATRPGLQTAEPAPSETPPQLVRTVVVGAKGPLPEDAVWVETADEALRQATLNKWPDLDTIELRFTGAQPVRPVTVVRPHLTIRAGQGHLPVLAFEGKTGFALDKHMIQVKEGGALTVDGVQLRWRLPIDRTPRDWAFFLLEDVKGLTLRRCVVTIENVDASGFPQKNEAAVVRLASATINQRAMQQMPPLAASEVYLSECIVRGEADLIAADEVEPFDLVWSEGLLVTSERLADIGGASLERSGSIRVELDHVTAITEEGLCRLVSGDLTPHQLHLTVEADHCLFSTGPSAPLVEHETNEIARLKAQSEWGRLLNWVGADNVRLQGEVVWRVEDVANGTPVEFGAGDEVWNTLASAGSFLEYDLDWSNQGNWAPQLHDRTVESYYVEPSEFEDDSLELPGFRLGSLPAIYRDGMTN